jgi:hypothetical protein
MISASAHSTSPPSKGLADMRASSPCHAANCLRTSPSSSVRCTPATCFSLKITSKKNLHLSLDFATLSVATRSTNYNILAKIPHQISEITKIHWLENSLQRCPRPQFDIPIGTWKSTNNATRTYNDLVQYLSTQYSSLSPNTPSRGGKAFGISDGPDTNNRGQGKNKKRRRGKGKGKANNGSGQNSNPKRQRQQQAPQAHATTETEDAADHSGHRNGWEDDPPPTAMAGQLHQWTATSSVSSTGSDSHLRIQQTKTADHRFYCAVHGHNTTHNGVHCRTMLRDQQVYTKLHLQARQPGDCTNPAGNDNVQYLRSRFH